MAGPVFVTLCEYATTHRSDGTFSVVRGGLVTWRLQQLPLPLSLWALVHVDAGALLVGDHEVLIELLSPAGPIASRAEVTLTVRNPALPAQFTYPIMGSIQNEGIATVRVKVGDLPPGETTIDVSLDKKKEVPDAQQ